MMTRKILILLVTLGAWLLPACSPQPIPSGHWDGSWNSRASNEYGTFRCLINLKSSGEAITGTFDCGIVHGTVSGTLSADRRSVSGTYEERLDADSSDDYLNTFEWQLVANKPDQFIGNHDQGKWAWCGSRDFDSLPDPCLGP